MYPTESLGNWQVSQIDETAIHRFELCTHLQLGLKLSSSWVLKSLLLPGLASPSLIKSLLVFKAFISQSLWSRKHWKEAIICWCNQSSRYKSKNWIAHKLLQATVIDVQQCATVTECYPHHSHQADKYHTDTINTIHTTIINHPPPHTINTTLLKINLNTTYPHTRLVGLQECFAFVSGHAKYFTNFYNFWNDVMKPILDDVFAIFPINLIVLKLHFTIKKLR